MDKVAPAPANVRVRPAATGLSNNGEKLFDWRSYVDSFEDEDLRRIGNERFYSTELMRWLKDKDLIGACGGDVAFPVHVNGEVIGAHYRTGEGWRYAPKGTKTQPLVIGPIEDQAHVFESQWDMFAYLDATGERAGTVAMRGASNGKLVAGIIPKDATVFLWTQNDKAGQRWEADIRASLKNKTVKHVKVPSPYKDLNDWTKSVGHWEYDGTPSRTVSVDDIIGAMVGAEVLPAEEVRVLIEFRSPLQLKTSCHRRV